MELRPGYKQTDVGIIPDNWDVVTLGNHLKFLRNGTHSRAELSDNELVKNLHYGDIHASTISKMSPINQSGLSKEKAGNLIRLQNGDIVFVDASEDMEGVGKSVEIYDVNSTEFVAGLHTIAVRFDKKILVDGFKAYLQFCPLFIAHLRRLASGTKVYSTNRTHIATAVIPLPQRPEQKAIATALSDVDALITSLGALIEKKKNIKQATMQELLTGKRRLAGFDGEWVEKKIGDVLKICHGKCQHSIENDNGKYPILATGGQIGKTNFALYNKPSVLIGRKGTINKPQYIDIPFWTVDTLFYSIFENGNNPKFFYYSFLLVDWMQYNEASGVPSLNAKTIENVIISIPPTLAEQEAIVAILSDMDTEIQALEARLNKTKTIKAAMMQELLTGKTRLKVREESHD